MCVRPNCSRVGPGLLASCPGSLLGIAIALCTLLKLIKDNEFQTGWAWVGLGIALSIAITALLRVRFRWRSRDVRPAAEPEAEPRPK
jgi:hypothetical protein